MSLFVYFLLVLTVLTFFGFGIYAVIFMLTTPYLKTKSMFWPVKMYWWFGVFFLLLVVLAVIFGLAMLFALALFKVSGGFIL